MPATLRQPCRPLDGDRASTLATLTARAAAADLHHATGMVDWH